jgi:hypothetical protein
MTSLMLKRSDYFTSAAHPVAVEHRCPQDIFPCIAMILTKSLLSGAATDYTSGTGCRTALPTVMCCM